MISLDEIRRARERIGDDVLRTPLVPLGMDDRIRLKLECLQPIGCFKLRGALSAVRAASSSELASGVVTASAGNMAQGVAWAAREAGVPARVIVPESAPRAKLDRIAALGAELVPVTHEEWWQAMVDHGREGVDGLFIHPSGDEAVMAGNGTIGLEIAEDAPEFDAVVIPWGGGGLTSGIASALKALRPGVRVVTAEPETGAPLAAAFAAGGADARSSSRRRGWTVPVAGRSCPVCGSVRVTSSTKRLLFRWPRSRRPYVCWPPARTSWRRAPERSRSRPR